MEEKKDLRRKMAQLKKNISVEERMRLSAIIMSKAEQLKEFTEASTVLLYYSLPDEVQTEQFLKKWCMSKRLVLPVVVGENLILKEYKPNEIAVGYKTILEPKDTPVVLPQEIDLAFVPGVAFDKSNNRLGRGKGFYDRLLPDLQCQVYGLAFPFQIVDSVPTEQFDRKLNGVISVNGLL